MSREESCRELEDQIAVLRNFYAFRTKAPSRQLRPTTAQDIEALRQQVQDVYNMIWTLILALDAVQRLLIPERVPTR